MVYQVFQDMQLSNLGMGAMRLPLSDGNEAHVDQLAVEQMVDLAMERGINYYDTAWGYHGGHSELAIGAALSRYPRERFYLADKFPGYDLSNMGKVREIFEEQLKKCRVEYFDFYLFHNVCEMNIDAYLDPQYRIFEYLMEQKRKGRIKHLGFSAHGSVEVIRRFLEAYGEDMEFCQLQLNYLDWTFQQGREKVELLQKHQIPIWVMEPLRGGKLAQMTSEHAARLAPLRPEESAPGWAFRFLQSIPGVTVILSGMSNQEQLEENLRIFETHAPLNKEEQTAMAGVAKDLLGLKTLPCTGCRYCTSHCPQGLDIPRLLELYNEHSFTGGGFLAPMALMAVPPEKQPAACVGCRSCEAVCPQQLKISEALADFAVQLKG